MDCIMGDAVFGYWCPARARRLVAVGKLRRRLRSKSFRGVRRGEEGMRVGRVGEGRAERTACFINR